MKLKVDKSRFSAGFCVYKYSIFFGWERYDTLVFNSYYEANLHAQNIRML